MHNTLAAFSRFCALLAERSFIESKKEKGEREKEKKGKRERRQGKERLLSSFITQTVIRSVQPCVHCKYCN